MKRNIILKMLGTYTKHHKEVADKLGVDPYSIKILENGVYGNSGYVRHVGPYPMYEYMTTDGQFLAIMDYPDTMFPERIKF